MLPQTAEIEENFSTERREPQKRDPLFSVFPFGQVPAFLGPGG